MNWSIHATVGELVESAEDGCSFCQFLLAAFEPYLPLRANIIDGKATFSVAARDDRMALKRPFSLEYDLYALKQGPQILLSIIVMPTKRCPGQVLPSFPFRNHVPAEAASNKCVYLVRDWLFTCQNEHHACKTTLRSLFYQPG